MHLRTSRFSVVDIETTGLNSKDDDIVAIAVVPVTNMKIIVHDSYYTLVRPQKYRIEAMKYHGIGKDNLQNAPTFAEIAGLILEKLEDTLVGYSVEFDYKFLKRHFKRIGVHLKKELLDIALVENWLGRERGDADLDLSLEAIMDRYGLRQFYRHHASADAFFTAQIFQMQLHRLLALGIDSTKKVLKLTRRVRYVDHGFAF